MWKMGAPVATPVTVGDCAAAIGALLTRTPLRSTFEAEMREMLGTNVARAANSGRGALFVALRAMKEMSARAEVVVPAFVCPSVGRAVIKAGLRPVLCDVTSNGSGLDPEALGKILTRDTLAVVTTHLFGYPSDAAPVIEMSHAAGALVIEDAAQAFGAKDGGRYVGTAADAGVYSFGMSKVLWSMGGGLLVTQHSELGSRIDRILAESPEQPAARQMADIAKFGLLGMLLRSHHLGPLDWLWSKSMRGRDVCADFSAAPVPRSHAAVARKLVSRLHEITGIRKANAERLEAGLAGYDGLILPEVREGSEPVFLRFPVIVKDTQLKSRLIVSLRSSGINVSEMYMRDSYQAMCDFASRRSACPRAEFLVERMMNLPTHPYFREADIVASLAALESALAGRRAYLPEKQPVTLAQ